MCIAKRSERPTCQICDAFLDVSHRMEPTCGRPRCRLQHQRRRALRRHFERHSAADSLQTLRVKANQIRDSISTVPIAETYVTVVTPANQRRLVRQPRRRKYRFAKRLIRIAQSTRWDHRKPDTLIHPSGNGLDETNPGTLNIIEQACSNCRGKCCSRGADHAYLNERALIRFAKSQRLETAEQVVSVYCSMIPEKSYERSCVFHSKTGCTLPHEMRSDSCKNTICAGVSELINRIHLDGESRFYLAATNKGMIVRTRFTQGQGPESGSD